VSLTKAIHKNLGLEESSTSRPSTKPPAHPELKEDIVIVGQAVRLPGDINTPESLWKALYRPTKRYHDPNSGSKMGP
jgi:hypothetical protein